MKEKKQPELIRTNEALKMLMDKYGMVLTKPTLIAHATKAGICIQPGGKHNHYFFNKEGLEKLYDPKNQKTIS